MPDTPSTTIPVPPPNTRSPDRPTDPTSGLPVERRTAPGSTTVVLPVSMTETRTAKALGEAGAAGARAAVEYGSMGLSGMSKVIGNATAMMIVVGFLFWVYHDKQSSDNARWEYERSERVRDRDEAARRSDRDREDANKRAEAQAAETRALASEIRAGREADRAVATEVRAVMIEFRSLVESLRRGPAPKDKE